MFRMILLAGASLATLASTAADAASFAYTGSVQTYAVTQTGIYDLVAGSVGGVPEPSRWAMLLAGFAS